MHDPLAQSENRLFFIRTAAIMGATAIVLGAFAAHGLKDKISADMFVIFETGGRYHMYHALALLAAGLAPVEWWERLRLRAACWAWLCGIAVFSGSLYLLAVTEARWLGAITPVGGVAFVVGWVLIAIQRPPGLSPRENS